MYRVSLGLKGFGFLGVSRVYRVHRVSRVCRVYGVYRVYRHSWYLVLYEAYGQFSKVWSFFGYSKY